MRRGVVTTPTAKKSSSKPPKSKTIHVDSVRPAKTKRLTALDYALKFAKRGIPVIWAPRGKRNPIAKGWPELATTDPKVIKQWASGVNHKGRTYRNCNFCLVMGHKHVAVDVDRLKLLPELQEQGLLPDTLANRSPKGAHFIFEKPPDVEIHNSQPPNQVYPGVDVRGYHGHIPCPGSVREDGGTYVNVRDSPAAKLPAGWLEKMIAIGSVYKDGKRIPPTVGARLKAKALSDVPEGKRNPTLFQRAMKLHHAGLDQVEIEAALLEQNSKFANPKSEEHVRGIAERAAKYGAPIDPDAEMERLGRTWWWDVPAEKMVMFLNEEPVHYTLGKLETNIIAPEAPRVTKQGFKAAEAKIGKTITDMFFASPLRRDYYGECYVPHGPREVWDAVVGGFRWNVYPAHAMAILPVCNAALSAVAKRRSSRAPGSLRQRYDDFPPCADRCARDCSGVSPESVSAFRAR